MLFPINSSPIASRLAIQRCSVRMLTEWRISVKYIRPLEETRVEKLETEFLAVPMDSGVRIFDRWRTVSIALRPRNNSNRAIGDDGDFSNARVNRRGGGRKSVAFHANLSSSVDDFLSIVNTTVYNRKRKGREIFHPHESLLRFASPLFEKSALSWRRHHGGLYTSRRFSSHRSTRAPVTRSTWIRLALRYYQRSTPRYH